VLEYRLLGPVQVYDDGRLIEAGPPRQRLVLAALLVDAGEVVGWDTLVDRVSGNRRRSTRETACARTSPGSRSWSPSPRR